MTTPTCHPDRRHYARGFCRNCYDTDRRARRRATWATDCAICGQYFTPGRPGGRYCCETCKLVSIAWAISERRGTRPEGEELFATRDRGHALRIARTARERGCRRIHPRAAGAQCTASSYFAAWHRGGGLYLVRVRWPAGEESEVAA